jgi:predicted acetyltransferase
MTQWTYGAARPADLDALARAAGISFAFAPEDSRKWFERAGLESARVVRDSRGAVAGHLVVARMGQYFGGRSVPMLGVAGVAVPPESRGSGVATFLMQSLLREARETGCPIASLYPATQPLYRRVGYEQAGSRFEVRMPLSRLEGGARDVDMRPATEADRPAVAGCYSEMARHWDGWLDRGPYVWDRVWSPRGQPALAWLAEGPCGVEGYVALQQTRPNSTHARHDLTLTDIGFRGPEGARRVLGFLAGFQSMGLDLVFFCGPTHPVLMLMTEQRWTMTLRDYWMLRVTDLPAAVAARGYPRGMNGSVDLEVDDALFPENAGRWHVRMEGGQALATRGGDGAVRLDIGALAALYSGYLTPGALRQVGRVHTDDAGLLALESVFPAGSPGMPDMF